METLAIITVIVAIILFWVLVPRTWRQGFYNLIQTSFYFLLGLIRRLYRWTIRTFSVASWFGVILIIAFAIALKTENQALFLIVTSIAAVILLVLVIFSNTVSRWFGGNREVTRNLTLIFIWLAINTVLGGYGPDFYKSHLLVVWFATLTGLVFVAFGIYKNITTDVPGYILLGIYLIAVCGLFFDTPRWIDAKWQQFLTHRDRESIVTETDAGMTLVILNQNTIGYQIQKDSTFVPLPAEQRKSYSKGDTLSVNDHREKPVRYRGEMMYEVIEANQYGDFMGSNIWIPARKFWPKSPVKTDIRSTNTSSSIVPLSSIQPSLPIPREWLAKTSGRVMVKPGKVTQTELYFGPGDKIIYQLVPEGKFRIINENGPGLIVSQAEFRTRATSWGEIQLEGINKTVVVNISIERNCI